MDFLWGAATSAHQIEGGNIHNDWWQWEKEGNIEEKQLSGLSTNHWEFFNKDLDLAQKLGINSYRFSIEWSRLEPEEGKWDLSALHWYENLVEECEKRNIVPMATLHHFTLPKWFSDQGGFLSEDSVEKFSNFVRFVSKALASRIPLWCIFNEPLVMVVGQYLGKFMPPALFNPSAVPKALRNILRCHVHAYDILHSSNKIREGKFSQMPFQVGTAHNMVDFIPSRNWHPIERLLTTIARRFFNKSWLDAITGKTQNFGVKGAWDEIKPVTSALERKTTDFIGINYYTKAYLRWRPKVEGYSESIQLSKDLPIGVHFARNNEDTTEMGWAIHPEGLSRMIRFVKGYGLPIFITENGIADGKDEKRGKYLLSHLKEVARERELGANILGYYYWSLIDNFEWIKGFGPRFGLINIDYVTFERNVRESAKLYQSIISRHQEVKTAPCSYELNKF